MTELIWVRCFFQTPEPRRRVALQYASKLRTMDARLEFLDAATKLDAGLLRDIRTLFGYRNQIAHCHVTTFDGKAFDLETIRDLIESGRGPEMDKAIELALSDRRHAFRALDELADEVGKERRSLHMRGIGTEDLHAAHENLDIAERAIGALRTEMDSKEWPAIPP